MFDSFDLSLSFILAQCVGILGYGIVIGATQLKNRSHLLFFEALGGMVIALQWLILSVPILMLMNVAYALICLLGILRTTHKRGEIIFLLSIPIMAITLSLGWQNDWISYITAFAGALYLLSRYSQHIVYTRGYALSGSSIWFVLNSVSGSIPGCLCNILYISGHARQLNKYRKDLQQNSVLLANQSAT